jgi:predicted TIM-barrel fold metal-dependent hydrolase
MSAAAIFDFHTHAFPDQLAARAIGHLERQGQVRAALDGTVSSLVASMDRAGIAAAAVCSIATVPSQFGAILRWSRLIAGPRLFPFPSVHPAAEDPVDEVRQIAAAGFRGVKLHPEYQSFHVDDPALAPLYRALEQAGLIALFHAGHDIGFPDSDRAAPQRFLAVHRAFPSLKIVASHLGGFRRWDDVAAHLVGSGVWLDTSYTLGHIEAGLLSTILREHRPDRILFGTDSPWTDQAREVARFRDLGLPGHLAERILGGNAGDLLGLAT